jgi:hypothetical protein
VVVVHTAIILSTHLRDFKAFTQMGIVGLGQERMAFAASLVSDASSLVVRPKRLTMEGALEFGLRLAWANGLPDVRWLIKAGSNRALRYCPICLLESGHWHGAWNGTGCLSCSIHHVWLQDRCHGCGFALRASRVQLLRCSCGADLREVSVHRFSSAYRACSAANQPPAEAVLLWLGSWSLHGPMGKPLKKASVTGVMERAALLEAGAEMVQGWPEAWFAVLGKHRRPIDAGKVQRVNEAWPGLVSQARRLPDAIWRDRVWAATDDFVGRSLGSSRPLVGRNPRISRRAQTQKAAADALGIGVARLQAMLAQVAGGADRRDAGGEHRLGQVQLGGGDEGGAVPERRTAGGRVRRVITPLRVADLAQSLNALVSVRRAAETLGCGRDRVLALVDGGQFRRDGEGLRRADVEALRDRVLDLAMGSGQSTGTSREWRSLDQTWRLLVPVSFTQEFLSAVYASQIRVWAPSGATNLRGVSVWTPDVLAWWQGVRANGNETLSLSDAADALGVKEQVAYELADRGWLQVATLRVGRRAGRRVTREAIAAFKDRYVALSTLTAPEGIHSHAALAWAQARGLRVVTGPRIDGTRQYFVERAGFGRVHDAVAG